MNVHNPRVNDDDNDIFTGAFLLLIIIGDIDMSATGNNIVGDHFTEHIFVDRIG